MNLYEILLFVTSVFLLAVYVFWKFKSWRTTLLLVAISLAPLYLSIERVSQFLTFDETYYIVEPLYIHVDDLSTWFGSKLRTTHILLGALSAIQHRYFQTITDTQARMLLKILHWLSSFVVFLPIHHLLDEHFVVQANRKHLFIVFIYTALLLPANNLALKVFNADSLSMVLGVLGIMGTFVALKVKDARYALAAIIVSFLASQEKPIASPILLFAISVYGYLKCKADNAAHKYAKLLGFLLIGMGIALLIGLVGALVIARLRHWASLPSLLLSASAPLISWIWPIFHLLGDAPEGYVTISRNEGALLLVISLVAIYVLAVTLMLISRFLASCSTSLTRRLSHVNLALVPLILMMGVVGLFTINAYLDPSVPILPGYYRPATYGGVTLHFGAVSGWQHIIAYTTYSYAILVGSVPSVYWLFILGAFAANRLFKWGHTTDLSTELLLLGGLLLPAIYGLLRVPYSVPLSARYFNLGLLLMMVMLSVKAVNFLTLLPATRKLVSAFAFATLLTLEVLPFGPLYGPFRPIWLNYGEARSTTVAPGRVDPIWGGWGEEFMLIGEWLEEQCQSADGASESREGDVSSQPCALINLYSVFPGEWLEEDTEINTMMIVFGTDEPRYTEYDYYIMNRSLIVLGRAEFPDNLEPVYVVTYRGYVQAWVFRGDQLRSSLANQ